MKTEIKSKVQKLIENYKKIVNAYLEEIKKWENDAVYSYEFKQGEISDIKAKMAETDADFNQQLKTIIIEEKDSILNSKFNKPSDYQIQISNTLGFINLIGDKLTDEQAFELVKPFFGDYQTMRHFQAVLSNRYGKDGMKMTIFSLGRFDAIAKAMDNLINQVANFFNSNVYTNSSLGFTIGTDALIAEIEQIEGMVEKFDTIIPSTYKEVKEDFEKNWDYSGLEKVGFEEPEQE